MHARNAQHSWIVVAAATVAACAGVAQADPVATQTEVLGPLTGHYARLHPANIAPHPIAYYGTDLGYTYAHEGQLHFLFGDTSATERGDPIQASTGGTYDDGFGTIDLASWTDGARITRTNLPLIRLGQNAGTTEMSAINPGEPLELFKTPLAGFSNGVREFALFYTSKPLGCRVDGDCAPGFACDTGLGYVGERADVQSGLTFACIDGAAGCTPATLDPDPRLGTASGFCSVAGSASPPGRDAARLGSVALRNRVGMRDMPRSAAVCNSRRLVDEPARERHCTHRPGLRARTRCGTLATGLSQRGRHRCQPARAVVGSCGFRRCRCPRALVATVLRVRRHARRAAAPMAGAVFRGHRRDAARRAS